MGFSSQHQTDLYPRRLRDRVLVTGDLPGAGNDLSHDAFIVGIAGRISRGSHTVSYRLASADAFDDNLDVAPINWMVLDSTTNGILDTNVLGY